MRGWEGTAGQCLLASVPGSSQQLVQSEWETLRTHFPCDPTSLCKAESQNNYTALAERHGRRKLWGRFLAGDNSSSPEVVFCEKGLWLSTQLGAEAPQQCQLRACAGWPTLTPGDSCHSAPATAQPGCCPRGRALAWDLHKDWL